VRNGKADQAGLADLLYRSFIESLACFLFGRFDELVAAFLSRTLYELKQRENSMTNASAALEASPRKRSAQENPFHDGGGTDRGYLER
jgi:hypothetical protein